MVTQKERLQNVGAVSKLAVGKVVNTLSLGLLSKGSKDTKIQANVSNTYLKAGLETLANKPAQVAFAGAVIANPLVAGSLTKTAVTGASSTFAKQNLLTKAAVVVATPAVASAYVQSSKVRDTLSVGNIVPASANIGKNVGVFIENPSLDTAKTIFKENPIGTGLIIGGAALVAGRSISGAVGNAITANKIDKIAATGIANAPLSDVQTKLVSESQAQKASVASSSTQPSNAAGAYNIQQNNYYSEKYIKKFTHNL